MARIRKIKAGALIEVLVAITILMTVVIIGTMVFVNVTQSSVTGDKVRAHLLLDKLEKQTIKAKSYFDEELMEDNLFVIKRIEAYQGNSNLQLLTMEIFNSEHTLLAEKKKILLISK